MKREDFRVRYYKKYGMATFLVLEMVVSVGVGYWVGKTLDHYLSTHYVFLTIGLLGGFILGMIKFYRDAKRLLK